jgi:hypothetical protein
MPPGVLGRSLLLAALLHLWLLLLVGNVPGGSALPGQGVGGSIDIRLGSADGQRVDTSAPPTPSAGPTGQAEQARWGGTVRADAPQPVAEPLPGAQRLGAWRATPGERLLGLTAPLPGPAAQRPDLLQQTPLPAPAPWTAPSLSALPEMVGQPVAAPPPEPVVATVPAADPVPSAARAPPALAALPAWSAGPALPGTAIAPAPAPLAAPALAPLPVLPMADNPLPRLPGLTAPVAAAATLSRPLPEPQALPTWSAPDLAAPVDLSPLPLLTRTLAPVAGPLPEPTAALPLPVPSPAITAQPTLPDLATLAEAPPAIPEVPAVPDAASPARADAPPLGQEIPRLAGGSGQTGPPVPRIGAPDAGPRTGVDVATPPSAAASAAPLNLNLPPPRRGALARGATAGVLQLMPRPPELKSKLEEDIEKAAKDDCRTAHSGAGLLAVVPLVKSAVTGSGCRW